MDSANDVPPSFNWQLVKFKLPTLSERIADIEILANDLLKFICRDQNVAVKNLSHNFMIRFRETGTIGESQRA